MSILKAKSSSDENFKWHSIGHDIKYFIHTVIPSANEKRNWSMDNVKKSLRWAKHLENTTSRSTFINNYKQLFEVINVEVSILPKLQNAQFWLIDSLLCNSLLSNDVRREIENKASLLFGDRAKKLIKETNEKLASCDMLMSILSESNQEVINIIKVKTILQNSFNADEVLYRKQLSHLLYTPYFDIITDLLFDENIYSHQNLVIIKWMADIFDNQLHKDYSELIKKVFKLNDKLFIALCEKYNLFYLGVMVVLKENAEYILYIENKWCNSKNCVLNYEDILKICKYLDSSYELKEHTKAALTSWCSSNSVILWHSILREIYLFTDVTTL